ncbi:hypothetical protein CABS01_15539 [Colletotrichum abscissum]|nr:uncharacterized protein CABS01_15539 [Colletotrichum abscissum]KAK1475970.1 hypothetical protein CABS01_15539 [Colletotrichum abscissum]
MGSMLDLVVPPLDHLTAQLFEDSFLDEYELNTREEAIRSAKNEHGLAKARVDISSADPVTSDDTSTTRPNTDCTAPNTPDARRGYNGLG